MSDDTAVPEFVASHPRLFSALVVVGTFLLQAGQVVASEGHGTGGP